MISAAELAAMRAAQELTMTTAVEIVRKTRTADGGGGATLSETTVATTVCRRFSEVATAGEEVKGGKVEPRLRWGFDFPALTDVRDGDRLRIGAETFEVVAVMAPVAFETARTVYGRVANG